MTSPSPIIIISSWHSTVPTIKMNGGASFLASSKPYSLDATTCMKNENEKDLFKLMFSRAFLLFFAFVSKSCTN